MPSRSRVHIMEDEDGNIQIPDLSVCRADKSAPALVMCRLPAFSASTPLFLRVMCAGEEFGSAH